MLGRSSATIILFLSTLKEASLGAHSSRRSKDPGHPCTLVEFAANGSCIETKFSLVCSRGIEAKYLQIGVQSNFTHMRVSEWPGECFNVARLQQRFPHLHHFELINSSEIMYFKGHFDHNCKIKKLALRGLTELWELPGEVVAQMPELVEIDLRHNVLRHMKPKLLKGPPKLQRVYLGDNKWDCSDGGLDWLAMEQQNGSVRQLIVDYFDLMCHQQLYRGKPLHKVMDIICTVRHTCPDPCSCVMTYVVANAAGGIIPLITVNCSARGLMIPPESLPPNTSTLRLEGNKLNSIRSILQNPQYQRLVDLYLDNNSISSVKELETSDWFTTFRVLSLRGNSLKQVPVYAFDKAFQSNNNIMHVYLGHNPWRCDCHFLPRFKTLLLKYKKVIKDVADIRCPETGNKETSMVQISTMSLGNVCGNAVVMPISTVNIVNIVLAALLTLVISKFTYDWYQFKKTGKLPWISSVLP